MKKLSKVLSLALAGVLLTSSAVLPANAAAASLGRVKNVSVRSVDDDEIKLKWGKVKGASGYQIYVKQGKGSWRLAETTKNFAMSDAEFDLFAKYHLHNCEKREYLGSSSHLLVVCEKTGERKE